MAGPSPQFVFSIKVTKNPSVPNVGSGAAPTRAPVMPDSVFARSPGPGSRIDQETTLTLTVAR